VTIAVSISDRRRSLAPFIGGNRSARCCIRVDPPVADRHAGHEVRSCTLCHGWRRHQPEAGALEFVANQKRS
jgi:hypothetical protein